MKNLIKEEIQSSKKNKSSKFLKTCFVGCLATCLTLTGIFAFAPLGATAEANSNNQNSSLNNNLNNSTIQTSESAGLITPRADDPIIFTTESGLDIKWGNTTIEGNMSNGNLSGFPYFTTNDGTNDYCWVIIGKSSSDNMYVGSFNYAFSNWKNLTFNRMCNNVFFNEMYENKTPAGTAIYGQLNNDQIIETVIEHDEIPENCVLVLANDIIATGAFNDSTPVERTYYMPMWSRSNILTLFTNYYNSGTFGLSSVKNLIQPVSLTTYERVGANTTAFATNASTDQSLFILAYSSSTCNFAWDSYLTVAQMKLSSSQWLRGGNIANQSWDGSITYLYGCYANTSGIISNAACNATAGYRPAFVMSLI